MSAKATTKTAPKNKSVTIKDVNGALSSFISEMISEQFSITSMKKEGINWAAMADVFEESDFIQTIGKKTGAKDKNLYSFLLSDELEVIAYEKTNT